MTTTPTHVQLNLIGGFELLCGGSAEDLPDSAKRVVAFLGLHRKPCSRGYVAGSLWPEKLEDRAVANLRSALWRLKHQPATRIVECGGPLLSLSSAVDVDVRRLQEIGAALFGPASGCDIEGQVVRELAEEKDLLFEELLPGWYEDWVLLERERLGEVQIHVLDLVVAALIVDHQLARAIDLALRLVALDPYREPSQVALIRAYVAEGSLGRARRHHQSFVELMHSSFGLAWDVSFEALCAEASRGAELPLRDSACQVPVRQVGSGIRETGWR